MDYIGTFNTNQNFIGLNKGLLSEGSISVDSFSIPLQNDNDAIEYAINLAKQQNHYLLSIMEITGIGPSYNIRKIKWQK